MLYCSESTSLDCPVYFVRARGRSVDDQPITSKGLEGSELDPEGESSWCTAKGHTSIGCTALTSFVFNRRSSPLNCHTCLLSLDDLRTYNIPYARFICQQQSTPVDALAYGLISASAPLHADVLSPFLPAATVALTEATIDGGTPNWIIPATAG